MTAKKCVLRPSRRMKSKNLYKLQQKETEENSLSYTNLDDLQLAGGHNWSGVYVEIIDIDIPKHDTWSMWMISNNFNR